MQTPEADERVAELVAIMEQQLAVLQDLEQVQVRMAEVLVQGQIEELDILLTGKQALIWRLGRLEDRRFRTQEWLADQQGMPGATLTFSRLLELVSDPWQARLADLKDRYIGAVASVRERGLTNSQLLQQGLAYLDFALHLLDRNVGPDSRYQPGTRGGVRQSPPSSPRLLDNRA